MTAVAGLLLLPELVGGIVACMWLQCVRERGESESESEGGRDVALFKPNTTGACSKRRECCGIGY